VRKLTHSEISKFRYTKQQLQNESRFPIYVLLDNIRSLYNVGSIFRTSDGARITKLFLTGYTPYPPRKEISKTALDATETVPWEYYKNPIEAIEKLKVESIKICLLEHTTKSQPYFNVSNNDFPLCLVVGNEITGVSKPIIDNAEMAIDIPMFGLKQSLNAAVAYGIAVFELVKIFKENKT
jgi:tRNA G18 (ribose-2'-O)-methylase SpoU